MYKNYSNTFFQTKLSACFPLICVEKKPCTNHVQINMYCRLEMSRKTCACQHVIHLIGFTTIGLIGDSEYCPSVECLINLVLCTKNTRSGCQYLVESMQFIHCPTNSVTLGVSSVGIIQSFIFLRTTFYRNCLMCNTFHSVLTQYK